MKAVDWWICVAIVALALVLRVTWLDIKPAHFDEGVNGWFVDGMTRTGHYDYDPTNFHGPLHFYILFVSQTLFGRSLWALRMPLALISTVCVGMMLAFRAHFGTRACQLAALAMAVSPAFVFYGRYAIHESELLFFLLLTTWGLAGLWRWGTRRHLWTAVAGIAGMILTKETWAIHVATIALVPMFLLAWGVMVEPRPLPFAKPRWNSNDLTKATVVAFGCIIFFYSGGFLHWQSLPGVVTTFFTWFHTGTKGESGHEKEWVYWFELLGRYEWPVLFGLAAVPWALWRGTSPITRALTFSGLLAFMVYSVIAYKTPWCLISFVWPFYFLFGMAIVQFAQRVDRWTACIFAVGLLGGSFSVMRDLNFKKFADDQEPYVYVQTTLDIERLLGPLRTLAARDPRNYHMIGHVVMSDIHPFPWLLGDFTRVNFPSFDELPEPLDADFLLIDDLLSEDVEPKLKASYYRETLRVRGMAEGSAQLYLRYEKFREFFPDRLPEFSPVKIQLKPALE